MSTQMVSEYNGIIMKSKIRVLTEDTINKIAAGEVIENPSSVVKELVENSLDAGASDITVEIKVGGRQLIRITDNGCGMNADDALLCLERHATSKLKKIDDVHSLDTMGFRGEAIPSIASISKFTLFTRPHMDGIVEPSGTMVIVDGGKVIKCVPVECAAGTTIEVKSLFFNVPVRKKFQKSPAYDTSEIQRMLTTISLGNPRIKFQLISNGETLLSTSVNNEYSFEESLKDRIRQALSREYVQNLCYLQGSKGEYKVEGFIGLPSYTKNNRTGQFLFINRRGVISPLVGYAIKEGYGTTLANGRHPVFVLHLEMPGELVDVNVHPQKKEVRLRQEHTLKELIVRSVEEALQKSGFAFSFDAVANEPLTPALQVTLPPSIPVTFAPSINFLEAKPTSYQKPSIPPPLPSMPQPSVQQPMLFETSAPQKKGPKVVGIIQKYIIAIPNDQFASLCLIDKHAAHSRILFEKMQNESIQNCEQQYLLIPHTIHLSPTETGLLNEHLSSLQSIGIQIKNFGQNTFMVDALPQIFGNINVTDLIEGLIKNLHEFSDQNTVKESQLKKLAQVASRAAVSSEKKLGNEEAQSIADQLMACKIPQQCPYGKPTMVMLTQQEISQFFR